MKQATLSFAGRASNPTKASPAQLAARKRFAEMARSGAFKKTVKRKANPATIQYIVFSELSPQKYKQMLVTENKQRAISVANVNQMDGYHSVVEDQVGHLIYDAKTRTGYLQSNPSKRKANPEPNHDFAKIGKPFNYDGRTWKVSKYAHTGKTIEAYTTDRKSPYRREIIEVSMLIGNRRKANPSARNTGMVDWTIQKWKRALNTASGNPVFEFELLHPLTQDVYKGKTKPNAGFVYGLSSLYQGDHITAQLEETPSGRVYMTDAETKRHKNPAKKTVSQKISQLRHEGYPQRQAVAVALSEQRAGKVKRNPGKVKYRNLATDLKGDQRVGYSVHLADRPSYHAIAWYSKKADAVESAQEAADRTGAQLAVSRVQTYFGK